MDKAGKEKALVALAEEMLSDGSLPLRTNLVFGEGNPDCEVMFIGEAPGQVEDAQKRPFVGRAGQLLRQAVREAGWKEEDVYITNIVKRRPPDNRDPLPEEIEAYRPYLTKQIQIISPPIIVALGRFAMNYFLPNAKITRDQGKVFRARLPSPAAPATGGQGSGLLIVPILHPAAALRGTGAMDQFRESFRKLPVIASKKEELLNVVPAKSDAQAGPKQSKLF